MVPLFSSGRYILSFYISRYFDGGKVDYAAKVVLNCFSSGGKQCVAMYEPS